MANNNNSNNSTVAVSAVAGVSSSNATTSFVCCTFNFGHIIDGMDDSSAGALVVSLFVLFVAGLCFGIGCWMHARRHLQAASVAKKYQLVSTSNKDADDDTSDTKENKKKRKSSSASTKKKAASETEEVEDDA